MAGERPVGQTRNAGWEIGVSRTIAVPAQRVWELLASERGQAIWLGAGARLPTEKGASYETDNGVVGKVRGFRPVDRIRLTWQPPDWDHESTVQVAMVARGAKTMIRFHQERLANAAERERQRQHWSAVLDEIIAALE